MLTGNEATIAMRRAFPNAVSGQVAEALAISAMNSRRLIWISLPEARLGFARITPFSTDAVSGKRVLLMSAWGHERTLRGPCTMSLTPPVADIDRTSSEV